MSTPIDPTAAPAALRFDRFELRPAERQLLADGEPLPLGGRAFDLLQALALHAGRLVTRSELIEAVWPGRVVEENNLSVQVNALRKTLGGDGITTVPGRGYRFTWRVESSSPAAPERPRRRADDGNVDRRQTHLPAEQPLLIGRSDDLAALGTLVEQHRLVTLTGAGGIGKTRLAQALLHLQAHRHPQGVCWVDLAAVQSPGALPGALATALGLHATPADRPDAALASTVRAAAGLDLLLALDNAEHLLDAVAALCRALLAQAPGVRLLVTSQAPLRLAQERVLRLDALPVPQGWLPATEALRFGAIALLVDRVQAADNRFRLDDDGAELAIALCQALDGLPLAIELAAARVPLLGLAGVAAALDQRLRLLTQPLDRAAPQRQRTLRAALAWSHGLLDTAAQTVFRRMAVLAGSAALELVQAVAMDEGADDATDAAGAFDHATSTATAEPAAVSLDAWATLDALDTLVTRSLVALDDDHPESTPRYRLLESPRLLALELLQASGEIERVRERHALAVLGRLQTEETALEAGRVGVRAWELGLEPELDHLHAALAWAEGRAQPELLAALITAALPRLPASLHDERLRLASRLESLIDPGWPALQRWRAWSAMRSALSTTDPGRSARARQQALQAAREQHRPGGDHWPLYRALCEAPGVIADSVQADAARPLLQQALALEDPHWPPFRLRYGRRLAGSLCAGSKDAAGALRCYRELLSLCQAAGDPSLKTRINLADIELWAGEPEAAVASGRALVAELEDGRDAALLTYARANLAAALLSLNRSRAARVQLMAAWPVACQLSLLTCCIDSVALLAAQEHRYEAAAQLAGAADARYAQSPLVRQVNEFAARTRAEALARAALGDAAYSGLHHAGQALDEACLAEVGFGAQTP